MKNEKIEIIVFLAIISLFIFSSFGMMRMHYGFSSLCSNIGGIWCYWPPYSIFMIIQFLFAVLLSLLIIWLIRLMQRSNRRK